MILHSTTITICPLDVGTARIYSWTIVISHINYFVNYIIHKSYDGNTVSLADDTML